MFECYLPLNICLCRTLWRVRNKYLFSMFEGCQEYTWLDGAEVSTSGWGSGGPLFQSHPRLTFQSCLRFQLNQLGSKIASESTFKTLNTCGVSNTRLYFLYVASYLFGFQELRCEWTLIRLTAKNSSQPTVPVFHRVEVGSNWNSS